MIYETEEFKTLPFLIADEILRSTDLIILSGLDVVHAVLIWAGHSFLYKDDQAQPGIAPWKIAEACRLLCHVDATRVEIDEVQIIAQLPAISSYPRSIPNLLKKVNCTRYNTKIDFITKRYEPKQIPKRFSFLLNFKINKLIEGRPFIVMGPLGNGGSSNGSQRPRFSWDMRKVPWTDDRGNQEEYANAVDLWSNFHDLLPVINASKIPSALQGIMLQSQLYGRARDLVKKIDPEDIKKEGGALLIVDAICKRDPLSVMSEVCTEFNEVLNTKRGSNESFLNFESRF